MRAIWAIARIMVKELIRKKDFYVLFIFLFALLGFLSSQSFFQIEGIGRYIRDFGYFLVIFFSFIIAVTFTAKQLDLEIESRTIYPLLAKPVSRHSVIIGKFVGAITVSGVSFIVFYSVFAGFSFYSGNVADVVLLLQGALFGMLFLCLVAAQVLFFANFLSPSANVTLSFLFYFAIIGFSGALKDIALLGDSFRSIFAGVVYYLMPHYEFYDLRVRITHAWDPLPMGVVFGVMVYTLIYSFSLLYFSGVLFRRRKL